MQLLKEEGEENMKSQNNTKVNGIHRAHTWEIGLYALNNTSTNLYAMLMGYVSYYVSGLMGVAAVLVGTLLTVMRVWDGVTDPVIGFVVDKTNGRFGKNRPFIVIGNVIMIITTYILYHFGHKLPDNYGLRLGFFVLIYAVYIIGYTCQCVVTKSAQSCMTNDPEQRPTFAVFDAAYGGLMFAGTGMLVSKYLVPKYTVDGISGFRNPAMFHEFWLIFAGLSLLLAALSIVGLWRKDRPQYYGLGVPQQILIRDYWEILKHNRAIQMLVVAASTDKLFQNIMTNSIVLVIVFGIICGDYGSYGTIACSLLCLRFFSVVLVFERLLLKWDRERRCGPVPSEPSSALPAWRCCLYSAIRKTSDSPASHFLRSRSVPFGFWRRRAPAWREHW